MINTKYSILIVDDELPIREELKMYDWDSFGTNLIGEAENGEEALEYCIENKPDIVITDIFMPRMDGLQFIKKFKEILPYAQVIILTTYGEFHLVQDALKLGAVDYLLKIGMDDEELNKAITKAKESYEKEKSYFTRKKKEKITILYNQMNSNVIEDAKYYESRLYQFPFTIVKFCVTNIQDIETLIEREINNIFYRYEREIGFKVKWLPRNAAENILIIKDQINEKMLEDMIYEILSQIESYLDNHLFYIEGATHVFAIISEVISNPLKLYDELKKLEFGKDFAFYVSPKNIYHVDALPKNPSSLEIEEIESSRRNAEISIDNLLEFIQNQFYKWANLIRVKPDELKAMSIQWLFIWYKKFNIKSNNTIVEKLWNTHTLDELIGLMIHELNKGNVIKKTRWEIVQAQSLIEKNISAPLSLAFIADKVHLSTHYLSRLFREEIGESFNEYVTQRRMDKAIELLQTTNLKVYEVANIVGIPNYRYFSVVFKKNTGMTPIEYKKV